MSDFKDRIKIDRNNSGEIILTEELKRLLIKLMKGETSKKDVMDYTGIGDKGTIEIKIQELVNLNPNLVELYREYIGRKSKNFEGYIFRSEAIEMLRSDLSQSYMAKCIGVNRRTFSTKIKNLQKENEDNELGKLLKEHADRKMRRQEITSNELVMINCILDEYEKKYPVRNIKYQDKGFIELRLQTILKIIETVDELIAEGNTLKELNEKNIISESNYRKYRLEAENLSKIVNNNELNQNNENGER